MNSKTKASRIQISLNFVQEDTQKKSIVLTGLYLPTKLGVITFPSSNLFYLFWKENKGWVGCSGEGRGLVMQVEWPRHPHHHVYPCWLFLGLSLCCGPWPPQLVGSVSPVPSPWVSELHAVETSFNQVDIQHQPWVHEESVGQQEALINHNPAEPQPLPQYMCAILL